MTNQLENNTITIENLTLGINNIPSPSASILALDVSANIKTGTVVATNGADSVIGKLENGAATLHVPNNGRWNVYATSGDRVAEKNLCTFDASLADIKLVFFEATVGCYVMSSEAVEVTCTNGVTTYTASGTGAVNFAVYERGTWTVSATIDGIEWTYSPDVQEVDGTYADVFGVDAELLLNDNSWETISEVSGQGFASNLWAVGDTKEVVIDGTVGNTTFSNLSIWAFVLGFDHNSTKEGTNRIHFQIGKSAQTNGTNLCLIDSKYFSSSTSSGYFNMNYSSYNSGGWKSSKMRTVLLGNNNTPASPLSDSLIAALPSDLRAVMKGCAKYSDNTGGGHNTASYVTSTTDYLWLLAECEVFGGGYGCSGSGYANDTEKKYQKQYAYYANGNSKVFYRYSAISSTAYWWLRSVVAQRSNAFCEVNASGIAGTSSVDFSIGIAPAFCV